MKRTAVTLLAFIGMISTPAFSQEIKPLPLDEIPKPKLVEVPADATWIECNGTYRRTYDRPAGEKKLADESDPALAVFAIDDRGKRLFQYFHNEGGFVEFCPNCKKTFSPAEITWSESSLENNFSTIAYGHIDRVNGSARDKMTWDTMEDWKVTGTDQNIWEYPSCRKVDPETYNLNKCRF